MLLTNNVLQQALPRKSYHIVVVRNESDQWWQQIPYGPHKFFPIQSTRDLPPYLSYNFILSNHIHFNTDKILQLSHKLHIPWCIYENALMPPQINKVTIKQLKTMITNVLVVFDNKKVEQSWSNIVSNSLIINNDNIVQTGWEDIFDHMKGRIYIR